MMENTFTLSEGERRHPLWIKLQSHFEKQVSNLHGKLEGTELTEQATAVIRGRIKCLKALIALGQDPPMTG